KEPPGRRIGRILRRHPVGTALACVAIVAVLAWGTIAWFARERDYGEAMRSIRESRDRGDLLGALDTLAAQAPRFGGREEFRQQSGEVAFNGGDALAQKLLRSQAFAAAGLASQSDHAKLAREAEEHLLRSETEAPGLILTSALSKQLSKKPA